MTGSHRPYLLSSPLPNELPMQTLSLTGAGSRILGVTKHTAFVVLTSVLIGACGGGDSATGPRENEGGVYELAVVDDAALPAQVHHGPWLDPTSNPTRFYNLFDCSVTYGGIGLDDETGRFWLEVILQYVADGVPGVRGIELTGDYEIRGQSLYFTTDQGVEAEAVLRDGAIYFQIDALSTGRYRQFRFDLQ